MDTKSTSIMLTDAQRDIFQEEFKCWQLKIGLKHVEIYFVFEVMSEKVYATISTVYEHMSVVKLNKKFETFGVDNIESKLKSSAKHEAMHLLIGRFSSLANARFITKDQLEDAEEILVRKLMYLI